MTQPLTERYRPKALDDIIGQRNTVEQLKYYADQYTDDGTSDLPNILFVGPPGVGKTATAHALARELYGEDWQVHTQDLNASDERGIDTIRDEVKGFARRAALEQDFKLIVLDEVDNLTSDAQSALRRVMEDYLGNVRFCLIANYPHKIIQPVRDRCATFRFTRLSESEGVEALARICQEEDIEAYKDGLKGIWKRSDGSLRAAINELQAIPPPITKLKSAPQDAHSKMETAVNLILVEQEIHEAEKEFIWTVDQGMSVGEVFDGLFQVIDGHRKLSEKAQHRLLSTLGEHEHRVRQGCSLELQGRCFLRRMAAVVVS